MTNIWMQTSKLNTALPASTNHYFVVGCAGGLFNNTEAQVQTTWRTAGTFSNMYFRNTTNASGTTSNLNFRVGGSTVNQTIAITSGATGEFSDATHTDAVSAGNLISYQLAQGTGIMTQETCGVQFAPTTTTNTVNRLSCNGSLNDTNVSTSYFNPMTGDLSKTTTEANAQFKNKATGTLQNMQIYISTNTASVATVDSRIGGSNGNITVSIGSGVTGVLEDTTHTDSVSSGNLLCTALNATIITSLTLTNISLEYLTTTGNAPYMIGNAGGSTLTTSQTVFAVLAGSISASATQATAQSKPGIALTASNLEGFVVTNSITANSILTYQVAGANVNQTLTYGSGVTGYMEDTTHTDASTSAQEINYKIVSGGTGSIIIIGNAGILAAYTTVTAAALFLPCYMNGISTGGQFFSNPIG